MKKYCVLIYALFFSLIFISCEFFSDVYDVTVDTKKGNTEKIIVEIDNKKDEDIIEESIEEKDDEKQGENDLEEKDDYESDLEIDDDKNGNDDEDDKSEIKDDSENPENNEIQSDFEEKDDFDKQDDTDKQNEIDKQDESDRDDSFDKPDAVGDEGGSENQNDENCDLKEDQKEEKTEDTLEESESENEIEENLEIQQEPEIEEKNEEKSETDVKEELEEHENGSEESLNNESAENNNDVIDGESEKKEESENSEADKEEDHKIEELTSEGINKIKERKWTILVYMSADNQLESSAIEDLCEMQNSIIDSEEVTILALVDRSNGYNSSNGDWTGTKLYRIKTGYDSNSAEIKSSEIDCIPLGLFAGIDKELEMSSSYTLSGAISYVLEKFPAEKNALIMWGHGTGWRNSKNNIGRGLELNPLYKGFAYDETSGTYMTLRQLGIALKNSLGSNKLDFIGFDTCFSGEIEVAYELRNYSEYFAGTEGLISSSGWNYKKLFDKFALSGDLSAESLCKSVVEQFSEQYAYTPRASICALKMDKINSFVEVFNDVAAAVGESVKTIAQHDELMGIVYTNPDCTTEKYAYGAAGYDIYLDVDSLVSNLVDFENSKSISKLYEAFISIQNELYVASWASDRKTGGLGIYFSTYGPGEILLASHPAGYISGKTMNQIDFVRDCFGYVPGKITANGLLDTLFYKNFSD